MRLFSKIGLYISILLYYTPIWGQYTVSPVIPDFMDLSANCVVTTYGFTNNPFQHTGIFPGRHTLITSQGTDPKTGGQLQLLPAGASQVIRLGNAQVGNEAESITYHFLVDPQKSVLFFKFAVVFEDPSHGSYSQPRFVVRIMDAKNQLIEACAEYDVTARPEIAGFQTYEHGGAPIRWRDWTNVGLDMSAYAGKEVQVQFITYDCNLFGHFGYAYFTASCISNKLSLSGCSGTEFTIAAPEGFASYLWNDGDTRSSKKFTMPDKNTRLNCELTSATGCQFTLNGYLLANTGSTTIKNDTVIYDTICQGESYTKFYYDLPPQQQPGNYSFENTFFDVNNCNAGVNTTLKLTVKKRYYPLKDQICFREDYKKNNFHITQPPIGILRDTLYYNRRDGCDSVVCLALTVNKSFTEPDNIRGDKYPCVGTMTNYTVAGEDESTRYTWEFPTGYEIIAGQGTAKVTVQVTDQAVTGPIYFYAANGCGNSTVPLSISPYPGYWNTVIDTVCAGIEYHKHNFHIPANNNNDYNTYVQYQKTTYGCDSITTLHLYNFERPSIHIFTTDSLLCSSKPVILHAVHEDGSLMTTRKIGDILCTNGDIIAPDEYPASGNTAQGIVFWLDQSGKHGWAVCLDETDDEFYWAASAPTPDLVRYNSIQVAIKDTAGYRNTRTIRETGNAAKFPAAYAVDFSNGWFLPAMGQLNKLYDVIDIINTSLTIAGGTIFKLPTNMGWRYWSSSQYLLRIGSTGGDTFVTAGWGIFHNGEVRSFDKNTVKCRVRAIRYF